MNVLAIILARGGSTRIPQKNLQKLGELSLAAHAAKAADESVLVDLSVVSTDDEQIARECARFGCDWVQRPAEISGEHATIEQAVKYTLEKMEAKTGDRFDYVVALQAAVPARPVGAIDDLLSAVINQHARGGVTVVRRSPWMWQVNSDAVARTWWTPRQYPRSQDVQSHQFEEINSIQVTPRAEALRCQRWSTPLVLMELPEWAAIDIDTPADLESAQHAWPELQARLARPEQHLCRRVRVSGLEASTITAPLVSDFYRGRIGIVLGNGPSIDALPQEFWDHIQSDKYLSIGVNRICCSRAVERAGFTPDMHLVWDRPAKGAPFTETVRDGLARLHGKCWRLSSPDSTEYPHDQVIELDNQLTGDARACRLLYSSTDAAANILYRLGCRQIYVYGVELTGGAHCQIYPPIADNPAACKNPDWARAAVDAWRTLAAGLPGVELFCGCQESLLVEHGVMPFKSVKG